MDDIDAMFSHLLGEMDHLSQSLTETTAAKPPLRRQNTFGFTDINESLNELEDQDLDALVADLRADSTTSGVPADPQSCTQTSIKTDGPSTTQESEPAAAPPPSSSSSNAAGSPAELQTHEPQTKADKIKLALENLTEAKLIVKVLMTDGSYKVLMVDKKQTVREVLDMLFEKTYCDCSVDWSLCETGPELQIERGFEDHECFADSLSTWTSENQNKIHFLSRPQKYVMFKDPQLFYMWKKKAASLTGINEQAKQLLLKENFGGCTMIVPDLEGTLLLKEDGKKVWKPRYFVLRASGLYYVPKGKTKSSSDLVCFVHFEKVDIYTCIDYKQMYRAPTNFCFMLKHPCIQKESDYIKFLCCEDEHTLLLWVNSIRIAKYGTVLYENYQIALKKASPTLQTLHSAAHTGKSNSHVENYMHESPPDFMPPPPPAGNNHV
ncbi:amyloid beta A4 precursor protein-binding family B member 1-interacting protein-like [Halichoeres trimaculatus]|uniref:amyloid beta A4 precursor protein-binding family B member 1-interacting protein-like n=1 Tax=Halichoeres trimaculatus TaxID=147232 RepID=UPI003D9E8CB2